MFPMALTSRRDERELGDGGRREKIPERERERRGETTMKDSGGGGGGVFNERRWGWPFRMGREIRTKARVNCDSLEVNAMERERERQTEVGCD